MDIVGSTLPPFRLVAVVAMALLLLAHILAAEFLKMTDIAEEEEVDSRLKV